MERWRHRKRVGEQYVAHDSDRDYEEHMSSFRDRESLSRCVIFMEMIDDDDDDDDDG
jgi:hypothetical protein